MRFPSDPLVLPQVHDHRDPSYHDEGEASLNARVPAAVRTPDVEQLLPVPAPFARVAKNILGLFVRPRVWWEHHRNDGRKLEVEAYAQWGDEQIMPQVHDLIHSDTFRVEPEPWATDIPIGG